MGPGQSWGQVKIRGAVKPVLQVMKRLQGDYHTREPRSREEAVEIAAASTATVASKQQQTATEQLEQPMPKVDEALTRLVMLRASLHQLFQLRTVCSAGKVQISFQQLPHV